MSLVLENISLKVGAEDYLRNIGLVLDRGSINVLLGPTLAGKTSLLRIMAGLDAPNEGKVFFDGEDVTGKPVRQRKVAMVYQQFINYPSLSVYQNIASPLRAQGLSKDEIDRRVRDAARLMKLDAQLERLPLALSGGQQQRTAIARALVKRAPLVLMDEPLANLDYKLREELREELPRIFEESGAIFVYATTEPGEALLLGGKTATLSEGQVTQFGPTSEVYRIPRDLRTAQIFSDPPLNTIAIRKQGATVTLATGASVKAAGLLSNVRDGHYTLAFRAHHLTLDPPRGDAITVQADVTVAEITGSESYIHAEARGQRLIALVPGVQRFEVGNEITLYINAGSILLFDEGGQLVTSEFARAA
jgi:glycerol transport system ATP-binding protein